MKRLLMLFVFAVPFIAGAQNESNNLKQLRQKIAELKNLHHVQLGAVRRDTTMQLPLLSLATPKAGLHHLPQDNMPCLVPDLTALATMPNAWKDKIAVPFKGNLPRIPNPATPLTLSPLSPLPSIPDTK